MTYEILPEPVQGISETTIREATELFNGIMANYTEASKALGSVPTRLRVAQTPELLTVVSKQSVRTWIRSKGFIVMNTRSGVKGFIIKASTPVQMQIKETIENSESED